MGRYAFRASRSEIGAISASRLDAGDGSRKRATYPETVAAGRVSEIFIIIVA